jgi:hypothetical protein
MFRTELLRHYGIMDREKPIIYPVKLDQWRISINETAIDTGGALRLSHDLERLGERSFAWHIVDAINSAKRNASQGL